MMCNLVQKLCIIEYGWYSAHHERTCMIRKLSTPMLPDIVGDHITVFINSIVVMCCMHATRKVTHLVSMYLLKQPTDDEFYEWITDYYFKGFVCTDQSPLLQLKVRSGKRSPNECFK